MGPLRSRIVRNVFANWLGLFTTSVVGFLLTPFILHRLGNVAFGLWILMTTFPGYYGLMDLGFRNAIIRYAARFAARDEPEDLARLASTALLTYAGLGLLVLVLTAAITWKLDLIFRLPPEWSQTAKILSLLFGIGTALGIPLNVFGGMLEGLQQFTWIGTVQVVSVLLRAGLIVLALEFGGGLIAVGLVTVLVNVMSSAIYIPMVFRLLPRLELRWTYAGKSTLHLLGSFGFTAFWIAIAQKLRFSADVVVIGSLLSVQAITAFSIGSKLVLYVTDIVQTMAQIFTPMFSHFDAQDNLETLRRLLVRVNQYSTIVICPLAITMLLLGRTIIRVWIGPGYESSYEILVILMVPTSVYLMQAGSTKILYGMGQHAFLAWLLLAEGLANLLLSIILLRWYGIFGVAWGTAIPLTITSLIVLPLYVTRLLGLRFTEYLVEAHGYPLLLSIPLALVLWAAKTWIEATNYAGLALQLTLGGTVYAVAALIFLYQSEGLQMSKRRFPKMPTDSSRPIDRLRKDDPSKSASDLNVRLKCLRCATMLEIGEQQVTCRQCGASWPRHNGIPRFFQPENYWGEIPKQEAQDLLGEAREMGWRKAVERRFAGNPDMLVALLDWQRTSWLGLLGLSENAVVLDIGSGYGAITHALARAAGEVYSLEATPERIEFTRIRMEQEGITNVQLVQGTALALPFPENSFDLIVVNGVLEWLGEWEASGNPKVHTTAFSGKRPPAPQRERIIGDRN